MTAIENIMEVPVVVQRVSRAAASALSAR